MKIFIRLICLLINFEIHVAWDMTKMILIRLGIKFVIFASFVCKAKKSTFDFGTNYYEIFHLWRFRHLCKIKFCGPSLKRCRHRQRLVHFHNEFSALINYRGRCVFFTAYFQAPTGNYCSILRVLVSNVCTSLISDLWGSLWKKRWWLIIWRS